MNSSRRIILIVNDSAGTMTETDWYRRLNDSAATVDNRIRIPPLSVDYILAPQASLPAPQAREKHYWMPKFERFKKRV